MSACKGAESIANSDLEHGELRKMLASPLYVFGRRENYGSSQRPIVSGKPEATLKKRELEVTFISRATSVWEFGCSVFIEERRTRKSVRKFFVLICWSVEFGKISS